MLSINIIIYYKKREVSPETRLTALTVLPAVSKTEKRMRSGRRSSRHYQARSVIKLTLDDCTIITIIIIILFHFSTVFSVFA
jgi:hypothetical protein